MIKKSIAILAIAAGLAGSGGAIASADTQENNIKAMQQFSAEVGVGTTTGAVIGGVAGGVLGCIIGGVVTVETVVFVPAGCLAGVATGVPIGTAIGTVVVGGPAAVIAGVQMVQVLITPPAS